MNRFIQKLERRTRPFFVALCLGFMALVGYVDYLTGFELFFSVFYLLGVGVAAWYLGRAAGFLISILSVAFWIAGDLAAGARYSSPFVPIWNAMILLVFYFIVASLLARLRSLQMELENRVRQRTIALTQEMAERERLEKELLAVSEREQRRIGHDLHDSLCQHLTGTALAGQVLEEKLSARSLPEADDAEQIVKLVEDGITMARDLARGLYPVEMEADGLMSALQELALNVSKWYRVNCTFECESAVLVHDANNATHLFRIAQEAVRNAVRHGKAKAIVINLSERNGQVTLSVEDDGVGLPDGWQSGSGLGTRIMTHRASIIRGTFTIEPNPTGGTFVQCSLPKPETPS